jgi:mono/diheme cytochrome c family protein
MAIPARFLRSFLPALVGAGLVLAACSSDSNDEAPGPDTNLPSDGGSDSSGGTSGSPAEQPEAGSPSGGSGDTGGTGGTAGTGGSNVGGEEPGTGGMPTEPGSGGMGGEATGPTGPTEGFLRGKQLATDKICASCHQSDFGGTGFWPNISPDATTGIGSWSDEAIGAAIREGVDPEGGSLCGNMMRYPLTDPELADLIEYLRGIPAVSRKITSACPL